MSLKDRIKQIIKLLFSLLLYYFGFLSLFRKAKMKKKAVILMYHNLFNPLNPKLDYSPDGMMVSTGVFAMHMKYLSKHYKIISLNGLITKLKQNNKLPEGLCVITFDDGWKEVYDYAFPVLNKYKFPATIFLTSNYIDGENWFWEERVKYLLSELFRIKSKSSLQHDADTLNFLTKLEINNFLSLRTKHLSAYIMKFVLKAREKNAVWRNSLIKELDKLIAHYGGSQARLFLNWREIEEMAKEGISFGVHTLSHCNLTMCSEDTARYEIAQSKKFIEEKLGYTVDTFAYPYGKLNEDVKAMVKESGFKCACSTEGGLVENDSDLFSLKRINIHNDVSFNRSMFACRIQKLGNIY